MLIFTIVVTYNGKQWYNRCFNSLLNSPINNQIIVVDNASSDDTVAYIKKNFPQIYVIESKANLGFAKANNIGIKYALDHGADYVFLLNQDAWVEENTLAELIHTFEDNHCVGIASPIHLNGSYSAIDQRFCDCLPNNFISDLYLQTTKKYYPTEFVNAAAWLISASCIRKIGGFDTSLFIHCGEDNNYCQRLQYHHLQLIINTHCTICHDREKRNPLYDENRKKWEEIIRQEAIAERWSDINIPFQMDSIIRHYKFETFLSLITLQTAKVKRQKEFAEICKKVAISRKKNMTEGLNWL